MDIRAEVLKVVNKVMGKTSFLDVCFFDQSVLAALRQIDYIQKTYDFRSTLIEFAGLKTAQDLYGVVKKFSPGFSAGYQEFTAGIFSRFANDIFRSMTFKKGDVPKILTRYKALSGVQVDVNPAAFDIEKITFSKIFSEILKATRQIAPIQKIQVREAEIMANLNTSIYEALGDSAANSINLVSLSKTGRDVIHFLTIVERVFKIKVVLEEVGTADIFTNVYKWVQFQRNDSAMTKAAVEQEVMAIAAKVFNDSNLILNLVNNIESKYKVTISKDELLLSGGLEWFVELVKKAIHEQQPQLAMANPDLSLEVMTMASEFLSKHFELQKPKNLTSEMENKFISDIEKKFKIQFSVFDLLEISGLDSIIKSVERLVKKQKIYEKYPGLLPATDLNRHVRTEIMKISRDNMIMAADMSSVDIGGLDFPKKIDSMLAIEVVVQLEKTFKIKIPEEKLYAIKNIDEIVVLIEKLVGEKKQIEDSERPKGDIRDRI